MRILLIAIDNEMQSAWLPLGSAYLAAALRAEGHDVAFWHQDLNHWPAERLTRHLDRNHYDIAGLGFVAGYHPYRQVKRLAAAVNASDDRPFFVLGGHGPSPVPDYFLGVTGADAVIIGEGEQAFVDLANGPLPEHAIIRREPVKDIDSLPWPAYHLLPMHEYRLYARPYTPATAFVAQMITGRGCPFTCNFCYRLEPGFRPRSSEAIADEAQYLRDIYGINFVMFADELLMTSADRAVRISEALRPLGLQWYCNGRLNYAEPAVLAAMKQAGCVYVNYGIESFNDDILERMGKRLTCERIEAGIKATLDADLVPGLNMIFGQPGETAAHLARSTEFLLTYDTGAELRTIRPVTPYPGCPLYYEAIEKGLLDGPEDFYERKHVNSDLLTINFTELSDDQFHAGLLAANMALIRHHFSMAAERACAAANRLYREKDVSFRGFRQ